MGAIVDRLGAVPSGGRAEVRRVLHVNDVLILVIGEDMCVVECTLPDGTSIVGEFPRISTVIAPEEPTVVVFEKGINAV